MAWSPYRNGALNSIILASSEGLSASFSKVSCDKTNIHEKSLQGTFNITETCHIIVSVVSLIFFVQQHISQAKCNNVCHFLGDSGG